MTHKPLGIVWFKRDLRLADHAPLVAAEKSGLQLSYIFIIEPTEWAATENALRHWQFQWASIQQIKQGNFQKVVLFIYDCRIFNVVIYYYKNI